MDNRNVELDRFWQAVEIIRKEFPHLRMEVNGQNEDIDAHAGLPTQPGLVFDVSINLQNCDELHLNAGDHFWVEWLPCGDQQVFDGFVEAVSGLLSGEYRIEESYVLGRAVQANLQRPAKSGWKAVTGWCNLGCFVPWLRTRRILQNRQQPDSAP